MPKLRFKGFYGEWEKTTIENIADVIGGGTPDTTKQENWEGNIQWFTPTEVGHKKYVTNSVRTISELGLSQSSAKLLPLGSVLLSSRATVGECSINTIECATNQGFQSLVLKPNQTTEFIYYLALTLKTYFIKHASGSTFLEISNSEVKATPCNIPSVAEQERISHFLSLLDIKIEKQQQLITLLKSYKRGLENIIFSPKYSTVISVSDMLTECVERSTVNNQYPIISSTKQGLFMQSEYFNKQAASVNTVGYKILRIGQIVFSPQNLWMGNINYNNKFEIGIVSPSYKIYKVNSNYNSLYVGYLLKSNHAIKEYISASEQGASIVRRNLDMQLFGEIKFSVPDITRQRKFAHLLNEMDLLIQKYSSELTLLDKTKAYLLQQLFI